MGDYEIVRFFNHHFGKDAGSIAKVIKRGVTLEEAQEHCQREDTHRKILVNGNEHIEWFDGFRRT